MKFHSQHSQRGVALVITLIMLSVITVMAVALLALARRERAAVSQTADIKDADYANNAGLEHAKGHIIADILTRITANPEDWLGPDLMVSRNYINPRGFDPALGVKNYTNVNFEYTIAGTNTPLSAQQTNENLANLLYDPRPPVYVNTNRPGIPPGPPEFRYYLDLNRNGIFDDTGVIQMYNAAGIYIGTNYLVGDPQWIGILERPNLPHSAANKLIGRFCYLILPAGKTLDVNFIHNHAKYSLDMNQAGGNGFFRNQGFGCWEINLAAFLTDLNTNYWNPPNFSYQYETNAITPSLGAAFSDATELLRFRYTPFPYGSPAPQSPNRYLDSADVVFPGLANNFLNDFIDSYGDGLVPSLGDELFLDDDVTSLPWPGADSKRHFFSVHDFFDPTKRSFYPNFSARLMRASTANATADRYSLYTLLSQLGTDSAPEPDDKININYVNVGYYAPGQRHSATNFIPWTTNFVLGTNIGGPALFFTTVADRLLRERFGRLTNLPANFGITNIPIHPVNYYTPAVHQLLQLAANIYDATHTNSIPGRTLFPYRPTVFKPIFGVNTNGIVITGYIETNGAAFRQALVTDANWHDLTENPASIPPDHFVYGIPLVIGAKKGYPNFNEYATETSVYVERKLQVQKSSASGPVIKTNQMFVMSVSNLVSMEAWNSYSTNTYTNNFPHELFLFAANDTTTVITNDDGMTPYVDRPLTAKRLLQIPANSWTNGAFLFPEGFKLARTNQIALPPEIYKSGASQPFVPTYFTPAFQDTLIAPQWFVTVSNRMRFFLFDGDYVVDAVSMGGLVSTMNVTKELQSPSQTVGIVGGAGQSALYQRMWETNRAGGPSSRNPPQGIVNQINFSRTGGQGWNGYGTFDPSYEARNFHNWLNGTNDGYSVRQAPFTAHRKVYQRRRWQANDPLVHHLEDDLRVTNVTMKAVPAGLDISADPDMNVGQINDVCQPWGGKPNQDPSDTSRAAAADNLRIKDPRVASSDRWEFPNQKFPSIGWLGRVHRGTPWQTVHFKSDAATDQEWLGKAKTLLTHPTNDWALLDIFTVAQHPNASRGQLPINQTNQAAWSAVLAGVPVSTLVKRNGNPELADYIIQPAALELPASQIVEGINRYRNQLPGKQFGKLSEILAVPELTVQSPFLHEPPLGILPAGYDQEKGKFLRDVDYERIPDQILSLLKLGDARFVIYSWGQSLKPAHVLTSRDYLGMVDNYQITGEVATRAVVQVKFEPSDPADPNSKPDYKRPRVVVESFNILPPD